jgi:hypothetical protein
VDILNVDDLWGCYEGELEEEVAVLSKEGVLHGKMALDLMSDALGI